VAILTINEIEDLCFSWRKALRGVTASLVLAEYFSFFNFIPILSQRSICSMKFAGPINFIRSCLSNESSLDRHIFLSTSLFSTVEPNLIVSWSD